MDVVGLREIVNQRGEKIYGVQIVSAVTASSRIKEMKERRTSTFLVPCLLGVLLIPGILYVAGYFALSESVLGAVPRARCRCFHLQWQANVYKPAAQVESVLTGDKVSTHWSK